MLRNVAIPLMLAASEAEAQPTAAELKRAMAQDREAPKPILIADAAACTKVSDALVIGAADTAVGTKTKDVTDAKKELATLKAGTWKTANDARKKAVDAAVAKEDDATIKVKLDNLDLETQKEQKAAAAYFAAKRAFDTGAEAVKTLTASYNTINGDQGKLKVLMDAADNAVKATGLAIKEEETGLKWLYCELGDIPAEPVCSGATVTDTAACTSRLNAYKAAKAATPKITKWWNGFGSSSATDPGSCDVPLVKNAAGTQVRPAIKYFTVKGSASGQLAAETQTSKFNRTLAVTEANAALIATSTAADGSNQRIPAGDVSWLEGNAEKYQWLVLQRTREADFYKYVSAQIAKAKAYADSMSTQDVYVIPAATTDAYKLFQKARWDLKAATDTEGETRYKVGGLSSKKQLTDATTKRDANLLAGGSEYHVGGVKREQDATAYRTYLTKFTAYDKTAFAKVATWATAQHAASTNAAKQYTWWKKARDAAKAGKDWNTAMAGSTGTGTSDTIGNGKKQLDFGFKAPVAHVINATACDESKVCAASKCAYGAAIVASDTAAKCLKSCQEYNYSSLGIGVAHGSSYGTRVLSSAKACFGYTFNQKSGAKTCKLYLVEPTAMATHVTTNSKTLKGADLAAAKLIPEKGADAGTCDALIKPAESNAGGVQNATIAYFAQLWDTWWTKYAAAKSDQTVYTDMATAAKSQATLEQAWLKAWYYQQFWLKMALHLKTDTKLLDGGANTRARNFNDWEKLAGGARFADKLDTSIDGSTANQTANTTALENARNKLAMLNSKHQAAVTAKTLVANQILNTTEQISDLKKQLVARSGLGTVASPTVYGGELAELAFKRKADYDVYATATSGKTAVALKAKTDAEDKQKDGTSTKSSAGVVSWTGEGSLKKDEREKKEAWAAATKAKNDVQAEITKLLTTGTTLAKLRAEVVKQTGLWNTQQGLLDAAIKKVATAELALVVATKDLADKTIACQSKAFDKYKATLDTAIALRATNLGKIETLLKGQTTPAPGTVGARCEKALSNGTFREKRDSAKVCGTGNCCGAARVWMSSGMTKEAAWRTIETCQATATVTYNYQPPRAPMAITMPGTQSADFACIEGAKTLAAAASAVAAAVYMLA